MKRLSTLPLFLLALTACQATDGPVADAIQGADTAPAHPAAFLLGCWRNVDGAETSEEIWCGPFDGVLYGQNRTLRGGKLVAFELLTIEQRGDALVYVARPNGRGATEFTMTAHDGTSITFENPAHDYPKRIRYRLSGAELEAAIDDGKDGRLMGFGWQSVR